MWPRYKIKIVTGEKGYTLTQLINKARDFVTNGTIPAVS